jgi:hypothetical protein
MKTNIYLFEFYIHRDAETYAEYEEYMAENKEKALESLKEDYPDSRFINSYIHCSSLKD